ncbi:hypothetical protein RUA4292_03374 [Ruegeria atlantica]|uniref:Uncharacterized protein n=1 Tax=Ruegeria atlantica TaxID=81569 RepID=A0A0P1EH66_9RHOB|nr:hypothetical protein RUA4292_03374 [Ruegeria atlantica]
MKLEMLVDRPQHKLTSMGAAQSGPSSNSVMLRCCFAKPVTRCTSESGISKDANTRNSACRVFSQQRLKKQCLD